MKEVANILTQAPPKTLVIFDIDMVLVQPSDPAFQMANMKRFGGISKRILSEIPSENQILFLSLMTISSPPVLIDPCIPELLVTLGKNGIPVMALTANLTGTFGPIRSMEEWRIDSLDTVGIDFKASAPFPHPLVLNELPLFRGNYSTYQEGILFVNGTTVSKGEALLLFLKKTNNTPSTVIFVDDREENLKSVELALQNIQIKFHGLHFLGAQNYPSKTISEEEFESKWQQLLLKLKGLQLLETNK